MKTIHIFSLLLWLFVSCGCCKEKSSQQELCQDCLVSEGLIGYHQDPAVDGCGWIIEIDNKKYSLNKFREEDLSLKNKKVKITYRKTKDVFLCGRGRVPFDIIDIVKIEEVQ